MQALNTIAKSTSRDASGVCVLIVRAFVFGAPSAAEQLFSNIFRSSSFIKSFCIQGRLFGKTSKFPAASNVRALLPLPSILAVADAIVALKLHDLVQNVCLPPPGVFFGAQKGTQVLDITHAAQLHLQKSGDQHGSGGMAQGDIATYYDQLNCMKIARWFVQQGGAIFWASAFIRIQALPKVCLTTGGSSCITIHHRGLGTLTGSRSVAAAGRIPVESVACSLSHRCDRYGVKTDSMTVSFASWVDNYYAFGSSAQNAIKIAELFEEDLLRVWGLRIKPTSRSLLSPSVPTNSCDTEKWPSVREADVLGHTICNDSSPWPCFKRTEKRMWAAFWKNCVGPKVSSLRLDERCQLLNRSVRPVLFFRNTRWPWTRALADSQGRVQRKMLSYFVHAEPCVGETLDFWHRRRMRKVAYVTQSHGTWGMEHAKRVLDWSGHLKRERNSHSLAAALFLWHDHHWLQTRRLDPDIGSGQMRPGTRAGPGPVMKRWDEALADAEIREQF